MMGMSGTAPRTLLNRPTLGVVPPPRPRLPQSSRRSAPPRCALCQKKHEYKSRGIGTEVAHAMADSTESMQTSMVIA